jgi:hypothetical protein
MTKTIGRVLLALLLIAVSRAEAANLAAQRRAAQTWSTEIGGEKQRPRAVSPIEEPRRHLDEPGASTSQAGNGIMTTQEDGGGEKPDPTVDQAADE